MPKPTTDAELREANAALRKENARLRKMVQALEGPLEEREEIVRAIRRGEVDALVVEADGHEAIYAIQQYDAVYRAVVEEALPYGMWLADDAGKLMYVSRSYLGLLGASLADLRAKGQFFFLDEKTREEFARRWAHARATGSPCDFQYSVRSSDGSKRLIWTRGIPARTADGQGCWAGINLDITEASAMREELRGKTEELEDANRRKDEFLALLGHEMRNPLGAIVNGLEVLQLNKVRDPEIREVREIMETQARNLTRMVDDLLDVSRITSGKVRLELRGTDLRDILDHAVESVRPEIEKKQQVLGVHLPAEPIPLHADPTRLEQVFVNLLNNAGKYTKAGGRIDLSAERANGDVIVRVKDNGMGILPETLPRLFELFVQGESPLHRAKGGLGIGLAVVRKLVEMHGGSVSASSDGPDTGSEFVVRLPIKATRPGAEGADLESPGHAGRKRRVLIAEDSPDLGQITSKMLQFWGHDVRWVKDGPAAVGAYDSYLPDVVLVDVGLPGMTGHEVAQAIRQRQGARHPLIIALTGYGQTDHKLLARESGCDFFMVKPVDARQLQRLLESPAGS